jgi:3'-5' exoribonuclease
MTRRFLNQLGERENICETFILGDKQLRQNRNGNLYLQMRLADRTGACNAMMWNAKETTGENVANGDYVRVEGTTQLFNGSLQIIVADLSKVDPSEVDDEDFVQISSELIEQLTGELTDILGGMRSQELKDLTQCFLDDKAFMQKFTRAPAAIKNHHAYLGGLLEHVVSLMRLCQKVSPHYPPVDDDQLLVGAFLHDIGKIDELAYQRDLAYTDEGQLIGHLVMGVNILQDKLQDYEQKHGNPFPQELSLRLQHMIVSHHGKYEFGSPKVPMTLEAIMLHYLDDLDAKLNSFHQLMADDANVTSQWTPYYANLGRKLFKGNTSD